MGSKSQTTTGYEPQTLSTDEPVNFTPPGFAAAGLPVDSLSPPAETPPVKGALPPRAAGTPSELTAFDPSSRLAKHLILHALSLIESPPEQLSTLDMALAKSASLVLDHFQDQIKELLSQQDKGASSRTRKKSSGSKSSKK